MAKSRKQIGFRTSATLFLLFLLFPYLNTAEEVYHPHELHSINCGSKGNISDNKGRLWIGDMSTKFLIEAKNNKESSSLAKVSTEPTIEEPYTSARISYSQFTYSFPLTTPGQKFIRLFFNPISYENFDPARAYFTVKSGPYTLLKDFNASSYVDPDDSSSIMLPIEYLVNLQGGGDNHDDKYTLNVTFIPSTPPKNYTGLDPYYYAFINGIEVVSMPDYLYYTRPDSRGPGFVGSSSPYAVDGNFALENMYRFDVGGSEIPAASDTGMLRLWEGDNDYISSPHEPASEYEATTKLRFTKETPYYTAPDKLYRTLWHMGENVTINYSFNLTWELPVDPGFTYVLRLHFCELDPKINEVGQRRFTIYIQDTVVENWADVLKWTDGQKGMPVVREYALIILPTENKKRTNISLKMTPNSGSPYVDAVLDGLEVFKVNDSQGNLAGPNPDSTRKKSSIPQQVPAPKKSNKTVLLVAAVVSVVVVLLILVVLVCFFIKLKKRSYMGYQTSKRKSSEGSSTLPTNLCRHFSIEEIRTATNNFDELFVIGVGGFGHVYKGYIDGGATPVAIKRLKPGSQQGAQEFLNEIEMLSQLRHLHLVSLIGYCYESNEMILVYHYMARGTLRDHLYNNTDDPSLSWKDRLKVCIGAARGLHYLHTGVKHMIIHRDVKSTNILLDEKWVAKVSDFGLSRVGPMGNSMTHVSTMVKGSVGYLDPEYYKRQRLTEKSDVYSFGVVLLEVLCGRPPLLRNVEKQQVSLVDWARLCHKADTLAKIVDPKLRREIASECLKKFGDLAMSCLHDDGTQRPSMNDVVGVIEFVLQLQENSVSKGVNVELAECDSDDVFSSSTTSRNVTSVSMTSSGDNGSKESSWLMSENVFSEIGDPKGR